MKPACQISAEALRLGGEAVKPGVTTAQIDKIIYDYIVSQGARPNFKGLGGFPGSACISVNDVVIHGIPSHGIVLHEGDIVSIDTGAAVHGWNGDNAATFACGEVSETAQRLMDVTKEALMRGSTWRTPAFPSCAPTSATAWAASCTKTRRCRTSARRGAGRAS